MKIGKACEHGEGLSVLPNAVNLLRFIGELDVEEIFMTAWLPEKIFVNYEKDYPLYTEPTKNEYRNALGATAVPIKSASRTEQNCLPSVPRKKSVPSAPSFLPSAEATKCCILCYWVAVYFSVLPVLCCGTLLEPAPAFAAFNNLAVADGFYNLILHQEQSCAAAEAG
jgi:hypothetical protein